MKVIIDGCVWEGIVESYELQIVYDWNKLTTDRLLLFIYVVFLAIIVCIEIWQLIAQKYDNCLHSMVSISFNNIFSLCLNFQFFD